MTEVAVIGDNNPPTPFDEHSTKINGLYDEAKLWLDGKPVDSEELAEDLANLMTSIRKAGKAAEESRKEEKKPHDDAGKAVQAKYKPLAEKATSAIDSCKEALKPWLIEQQRIADEKAAAARKEAEEKERIAQEAFKKANAENLAEREAAHNAAEEARKATATAKRLEKAPTNTNTAFGRNVGLRTRKVAVVTDLQAAAAHFWGTDEGQAAFKECVEKLASNHMHSTIPGIEIQEVQNVA